jgi:Tol biopolymer transport system component
MLKSKTKRIAIVVILLGTAVLPRASRRGDTAGIRHSFDWADECSFGPAQSLGPTINSNLFEGGPTVSADERTLIITATRDPRTEQEDLFISHRARREDPWGILEPLAPEINDPVASEFSPRLSPDGKTLYFGSNRAGGFGASDLYVSTRESPVHPWKPAENLGPVLNTSMFEAFATPSKDGNTLYFERSTAAASSDADIWVTTRKNKREPWGVPQRLSKPINGTNGDFSPSISTDGLTLYFGSVRPGNTGSVDIWVSHRSSTSAAWGQPENLGPNVNRPFSLTLAPFITTNGSSLYFMSTRPGGLGQPGCRFLNCLDLYVAQWECRGTRQ